MTTTRVVVTSHSKWTSRTPTGSLWPTTAVAEVIPPSSRGWPAESPQCRTVRSLRYVTIHPLLRTHWYCLISLHCKQVVVLTSVPNGIGNSELYSIVTNMFYFEPLTVVLNINSLPWEEIFTYLTILSLKLLHHHIFHSFTNLFSTGCGKRSRRSVMEPTLSSPTS